MRFRLAFVILFLIAFFSGRESASWHVGPAVTTDGDTVKIGAARYRLKGVRAPEAQTAAGGAATLFVRDAVIAGQWIACRDTGHATFDRHEAFCFNSRAADIGAAVIAAGYGCAARQARYRVAAYSSLERDAPRHPPDCGH